MAADIINDRVLPFYDEQDVKLLRILTDRGSEYKGVREHHEYELYLTVEDIEHSYTKVKSPQSNGICERFHKTILEEFYNIAFRKKIYRCIEELQKDLDDWLGEYNYVRTHQGKHCNGLTPMECFTKNKHLAQIKMIGYDNESDLQTARGVPFGDVLQLGGGFITTVRLSALQYTLKLCKNKTLN